LTVHEQSHAVVTTTVLQVGTVTNGLASCRVDLSDVAAGLVRKGVAAAAVTTVFETGVLVARTECLTRGPGVVRFTGSATMDGTVEKEDVAAICVVDAHSVCVNLSIDVTAAYTVEAILRLSVCGRGLL
jgi:hypothetical protein